MADFPSLIPTSRSFDPGDYPKQEYRTLSGAVWKRVFGSVRVGMTLNLEFANITDNNAALIINHYRAQVGTIVGFNIPESFIYGGMSSSLVSAVDISSSVEWVYAGPPSVTSVVPGISTVSVSLVGEPKYP